MQQTQLQQTKQDSHAANICSILTNGHHISNIAMHVNIRREVKILYLIFVQISMKYTLVVVILLLFFLWAEANVTCLFPEN